MVGETERAVKIIEERIRKEKRGLGKGTEGEEGSVKRPSVWGKQKGQ